MNHCVAMIALGLSLSVLSAAEPAPPPRSVPTDAFGQPLPKGAKARFGSSVYRAPYSIRPLAVSPDGRLIALASDGGGGWQILRADTGRVERELEVSDCTALDLVGFSADSRRLAAWGAKFRGGAGCRVWEVGTGKDVGDQHILIEVDRDTACLSTDGRLAAGVIHEVRKRLAKVWEVESGKVVCSIEMLANDVGYLAISPDGKRLATWGTFSARDGVPANEVGDEPNQILQLWDVATGKETARIRPASFYAHKSVFSPDGKLLVTAGNPMEVWDTTSGKRVRTLLARQYQGKAIAFSPDGKTMAGVGHTGWVELWDVATGRRTAMCRCAGGTPLGVVFPAKSPPLAYGQDGQAVRLWKILDGQPVTPTAGHIDRVVALTFSPDNRSLVSVGADSRVLQWDVATGRQLGQIALDGDRDRKLWPGSQELLSAVLFPGGKRLAAFGERQSLTVYDLATGHEDYTLHPRLGRGGAAAPVAVSPDGTRIASFGTRRKMQAGEQAVAMVWDTATGETLLEQPIASTFELSVGFTADGSRLVASAMKPLPDKGFGYEVVSWEVGTGKPLGRSDFPRHKHPIRVSAGPDERSVVVDLGDGEVIVWNVNDGRAIQTISEVFPSGKRDGFVVPVGAAAAVSPDGRLLAVGAHSPLAPGEYLPKDGIVRVVDLASGRVKSEFSGHRAIITALAFSPDGKTLASGSQDTTVLLWDLSAIGK